MSTISLSANAISFVAADPLGHGARVSIFSPLPYEYNFYSGYDENSVPRGFVTDFNANKIPATTLSFEVMGAQTFFVTLIVPGSENNDAQIDSFEDQPDNYSVFFSSASSEKYELIIPKVDGIPTVQKIDG